MGAVFKLGELVDRMNAVHQLRPNGRPRWDRWSLRRMLEAGGVRFTQRCPGGDLYVTLAALRDAFPDAWESLLDAEALSESRDLTS